MLRTRSAQGKSNIISSLPGIPANLIYGSLTYTESIDSGASIKIVYKGILERNIASYIALRNKIKTETVKARILNIDCVITSVSIKAQTNLLFRYSVTVDYKSEYIQRTSKQYNIYQTNKQTYNAREVATKANIPYSGNDITLPLKADGDKFLVTPASVFSQTAFASGHLVVNGKDSVKTISLQTLNSTTTASLKDLIEDINISGGKYDSIKGIVNIARDNTPAVIDNTPSYLYVEKPSQEETIVESDPNPTSPPEGSTIIRTIDSNSIDGSGPKKTRKTVTTLGGKTVREEIDIYGFRYTSADLNLASGTSASALWKQIEKQIVTYNYKQVSGLFFEAYGTPPGGIGQIDLLVHPDYENLVTYSGIGNRLSLNLNNKYLTEITTTGWQYNRYEKESSKYLEATFATESERDLYKFALTNKKGKTSYKLRTQRSLFDDKNLPFKVEWVKVEDVPSRLRNRVGFSTSSNGYVGIIYPTPNYVEPLAIVESYDIQSSFDKKVSPYITKDKDGNDITTYIVKGEETRNEVIRTIMGANKYKEKVREYSARNGGFEDVAEREFSREVSGSLPQAQYQAAIFEKQESEQTNQLTNSKKYRLQINNPNSEDLYVDLSLPSFIDNIGMALTYLKTELISRSLSVATKQIKYAWYDPNIKVGDGFSLGDFTSSGTWIVTNHSVTFNFNGKNNLTNKLLITADGHQITCGNIPNFNTSFELAQGEASDTSVPKLEVSVRGGDIELSDFEVTTSRRNF